MAIQSTVRRSGIFVAPSTTWRPSATLETLRKRRELVERVRKFFAERKVLEVDVPVLQGGANLDPGVHPFVVETSQGPHYLPTSPEHPLKRLVAAGYGPVWALAPAFRADERGRRHAPEFRMLEWYRPGWDDWRLLREVLALFDVLTGWGITHDVLSYRAAFAKYVGIDPSTCQDTELENLLGADAAAVRTPSGAFDHFAALDLLLPLESSPTWA